MQVWQKAMAFVVMGLVAMVASTWAITAYVVRNNEMDRCERQLQQARHAAAVEMGAKAVECSRALTALQAHLTRTCDKAMEAQLAALGERVTAALRQGALPQDYRHEAEAIAIDQDGVVLTAEPIA